MTFRIVSSCLILFAATISGAEASAQSETFKDWKTSLEEVNTGEDVRKTCTAETSASDAAGTAWTLKLGISNGDVLPPDAYPQITITVAGGGLPNGENQPAVFGFGDKRVDAQVSGGGNEVMVNNVKETSLALLKAFASGSTLDLALPAKPGVSVSLAGFTASYRKLGSWCGFPTTDIAK